MVWRPAAVKIHATSCNHTGLMDQLHSLKLPVHALLVAELESRGLTVTVGTKTCFRLHVYTSDKHSGTFWTYEGVLCSHKTPEAVVLPPELAGKTVPVLCVEDMVDRYVAGAQSVAAQWVPPDDLRRFFSSVSYDAAALRCPPVRAPRDCDRGVKLAVCVSGGLRTLCTGVLLLKRFVLDVFPLARVHALTWRDPAQNYSPEAVQFLKDVCGSALATYHELDDMPQRLEEEAARVEAYRDAVRSSGGSGIAFVTQLWYRRWLCNQLRREYEADTGDACDCVLRFRFDGFISSVPNVAAVGPKRLCAKIDLASLARPEDADAEVQLGLTYPAYHKECLARGGPSWQFGSELHTFIHYEKCGIAADLSDRHMCQFGRATGGLVEEGVDGVGCPVLNTIAAKSPGDPPHGDLPRRSFVPVPAVRLPDTE